jgi:integrase
MTVALNRNSLHALRQVQSMPNGKSRIFCALRTGEPMRSPRMWFDGILKDAKISDFHWHDLRHCFATRLRAKKVRLVDIADALGHKTLSMSRRYAHLGHDGLHDVAALLDTNATDARTEHQLGVTLALAINCLCFK